MQRLVREATCAVFPDAEAPIAITAPEIAPQISPQRTPPPKPEATASELFSSSPVYFPQAHSTHCAQLKP